MARSKHEKLHKWKTNGTAQWGGVNFFVYVCTRCQVTARNGQPMSECGGMECK